MGVRENRAFMQEYVEAVNGKDKPPGLVEKYVDNEDLKEHIALFEAAFPRYELIAEEVVFEGDTVAMRGLARGRHDGDFMGIPPTGKEWEITLMIFYHIVDGKIAGFWTNADQMSLMQQLGVMPAST
jgi:predicted ester cyclase